ncbi:MAG: dehydrogenase [Bacteroidetes bacterium HGW-Bacteroidetes-8]|jgi:predicted dehydrogenase/threonine dehydrogenase-like Zn-dependent dehydrogenase|nr:MAG: dehydrogenase [Bacteroidetes bacterium HGW-Bacteroidetes-8]
MKQIIQDLKSGQTILEEVPAPQVKSGNVLIKTSHTLVSLGTERSLVEFGKANLLDKARQQPDRVKQVLDKIRSEGLLPTLEAVFNKLNQPLPLGYCNVGVVKEVGKGVTGFNVGDRVASNGGHAEYVCVPENLCAKIPDNVSNEEAAFTVIGSIGLEGIRLCNPTFGETIVVVGLGLIGLITASLLKSNGCRVVGYDFDQSKVDIAKQNGIIAFNPSQGDDPVKFVKNITNGIGADGVIITASNKSDEIIHQTSEMSRQRGRIILVGVIGLDIRRDDFYKKELTFQVSCSYGPGRYDDNYEQKGIDYPIGFVRWTEKRNFEAILNAISDGQLKVSHLITEKVILDNYLEIYGDMRKSGSIASILVYPESSEYSVKTEVNIIQFEKKPGIFGIIGAGNFTSATVLPRLKKIGVPVKYIASAGGLTAKSLAKKAGIANATSDYRVILEDEEVDSVIITTRHNLHAKMVIESLSAGKHVFVEKPLCLNIAELEEIISTKDKNPGLQLVVGFNRRFAPLALEMKRLIGSGPKNIVATMNAGFIPKDIWVHNLEVGGGRIIGEACHFIDLCSFLTGSKVRSVCMNSLGVNPKENTDNASILLKYDDGSNAVINYFSNGSKAYSKERIEIYNQEKTIVIDNWRRLYGYGVKPSKIKSRMDKGHLEQFSRLKDSIKTGVPIIPFDEIINTTKAIFAAIDSLKKGRWIDVG